MAKRGKRAESETNGAAPEPANGSGIGHNSAKADLTDEQRQALAFQWKKKLAAAEAKKDAAVAEIRNIRKQIKAELGADGVETIRDMMSLETEGGEAKIKAQIERAMRAARWMAIPLGMQGELFERAPAVDQAREAGKVARLNGDPAKPPHDPSVPQHQAWLEGYHDAEKALHEAQKRDDALVFDKPPIGEREPSFEEHAAN